MNQFLPFFLENPRYQGLIYTWARLVKRCISKCANKTMFFIASSVSINKKIWLFYTFPCERCISKYANQTIFCQQIVFIILHQPQQIISPALLYLALKSPNEDCLYLINNDADNGEKKTLQIFNDVIPEPYRQKWFM